MIVNERDSTAAGGGEQADMTANINHAGLLKEKR